MTKKKTKKQRAPEILVRKPVRGVTRREAFDKAQVGFDPAYQKHWVEKVGWTPKMDSCKIFSKKVPWYEKKGRFLKDTA